ncbi:MAG: methionyl aminopeptidase [Clostridiales bacterium]|nr:methionyl aminopeptidase [Clostridiales bacterium]
MGKIGRNDKCWCGSGRKYKACHMSFDNRIRDFKNRGYEVPNRGMIRTPEQIAGIREAGKKNTMVLDYITPFVKEGVSTEELDVRIEEYTRKIGCIPACLGYQGYPKSVCTSVDDVVCHGIPSKDQILKSGDIVNVDCTTIYNGYFGDASRMFCIGEVSEEKRKLVQVTKECLDLALEATRPWGTMGDMGYACNKHARENGYSIVREIGGHGCGVRFHEDPWVNHIGTPHHGILFVPGMTFTIEPMVNMGEPDVFEDENDGWTIYTQDGKPSAQWEYTILVTENGTEILSY